MCCLLCVNVCSLWYVGVRRVLLVVLDVCINVFSLMCVSCCSSFVGGVRCLLWLIDKLCVLFG